MKRSSIVKWTYVVAVGSTLVWIIDASTQGLLTFSGDGLVTANPSSVAFEYTLTIQAVLVKEGEEVRRRQPLMKVSSIRLMEAIIQHDVNITNLNNKLLELTARAAVIDDLVAVATERESAVSQSTSAMREASGRGFLPATTRATAEEQLFRSKSDLTALTAEKATSSEQIVNTSRALDETVAVKASLVALQDDGNIRSPVDGTVLTVHYGPGTVVREGTALIDLVDRDKHVVAFFSMKRWYDLREGRLVTVDSGNASYPGRVAKVSLIAGRLPAEFQRTLAPVERAQIVRVDVEEKGLRELPFNTKVRVKSRGTLTSAAYAYVRDLW